VSLTEASTLTCPFCGLTCDDLVRGPAGVDSRGCAKAAQGFARGLVSADHRVGGVAATLDDAATAAARILSTARLPLVTGLSTDLAGVRALIALADKAGATIDRWQSAAQQANLEVSGDSGAFLGTFSEIANRADVVLLVGRTPGDAYPRLGERLLRNRTPLYRANPPWVTFLGPEAGTPADLALAEQLACPPDGFVEALGALSALLLGRKLRAKDAAGVPIESLATLADRLKAARYSAILWDAADFPAGDGEIALGILLHILRTLNRTTRSVGLPLGGNDNALGASQALLWQTGWPSRVSFSRGMPEHDPWLYDAERLVKAGEADALVWAAAISPAPPPVTSLPTIAIVAADTAVEGTPDIVIRVGVPALDHRGAVVRADNVVALPVSATRSSTLPSVAEAASAILARLGECPP
jgi:formylmethanofuran dehydrogenase subunit B